MSQESCTRYLIVLSQVRYGKQKTVTRNQIWIVSGASQVVLVVKNLPANTGDARDVGLIPWIRKIPWKRAWQPTPVFLPRESDGQRSLASYSPQGCKEPDMTEKSQHASKDGFQIFLTSWVYLESYPTFLRLNILMVIKDRNNITYPLGYYQLQIE